MKKMRFSLLHRSSKNKNFGEDKIAPIYVMASLGRKYVCIPTGVQLPGRNWDARKERVINHPRMGSLNKEVQEVFYDVQKHYQKLLQKEGTVTPARLKDYYLDPSDLSFSTFYRKEMLEEAKDKARRTIISYNQTYNKLNEYQKNISFEDISSPSFILDFTRWLTDNKGHKRNNVHKHFKNIRKFINIAILRGHIAIQDSPIPALKGRITTERTEKIYLTITEFSLFENLRLEGKQAHLQKWLDCFLFLCYTGLRFGDVTAIKERDIEFTNTADGMRLYLSAEKTGKTNFIPLRKLFPHPEGGDSKPERILRAIMSRRKYRSGQRFFPYNHVQPFNRALKKIAGQLDVRPVVQQRISSHTGRKTCVNLLYRKGADTKLIQAITQHSQDREMMIYLDISSEVISSRLDYINW